jgi:ribosome recycling factor
MGTILDDKKGEFLKVIEHLHTELATLRTGRASTGLLATVMVESYGSKMPLQNVASVTVSDAKTLTVSPWDKSQLQEIEKGIMAANLGFTPSNDGNVIRINLPMLTEERRKELVKFLGQLIEKSRISVRNIREDIMKQLKKAEADGEMSKDDLEFAQKKLQAVVDDMNAQIKSIGEDKEKEIMTV